MGLNVAARRATILLLSLVFCGVALASEPASRVDPVAVKLLQREVEILRGTVDDAFERLDRGEAEASEGAAERAAMKARLAELEALSKRLDALEARGAAGSEPSDSEGARRSFSDWLSLDGHILLRPEYVDNLNDFAEEIGDEDFYYRQRLRLGLSFQPLSWLTVRADVQSAIVWGTEVPADLGMSDQLGLYQAYVHVTVPWVDSLWLRAGRMGLELGAGRLIGRDDFRISPNFFDGGLIHYEHGPYIRLDAFGFVLRERFTPIGRDRNIFGLYASTNALENATFDLYVMYLSDGDPQDTQDLVTLGARAAAEPIAGLKIDGEAVLQVGAVEPGGGPEQDVLATAYFLSVDYTIPVWSAPRAGLFFSSASGDSNPVDDRYSAFDPLYPSRHAFWGAMDLFSWTNIIDYGGRLGFAPMDGLDVGLEIHRFHAVDPDGTMLTLPGSGPVSDSDGGELGTELDFLVRYRPLEQVALALGYSFFLPDDAFKRARGQGDRADWLYLELRADL